ncbi:MAG TPA: hypothetical protein VHW24_26080 [Bryobacteraceae bacterium]|jgi:hypothetical protein|nr:hypothetical protein [Bryobacteraceae bacterium]
MRTRIGEDSPPDSNDLEGWRQAIVDKRLGTLRLESIAAAFQDLAARDTMVRNGLAKHLSDAILRILRGRVGVNHPNRGEDIIFRIHGAVFMALLQPASADGQGLREAFVPRVLFRMKDAIAKEERERRIPDEVAPKHKRKAEKSKTSADAGEVELVALAEYKDDTEETEGAEDGQFVPQRLRHASPFDGVRDANEQIDVDRILERVPDPRKRLAFWLFMNDVPYESKRKDVTSIARALGVSDKTAREWVEEVRHFLEESEDIQRLKCGE